MTLTEQQIQLPERYSIPPDAVGFRDGLVAEALAITQVTNATEQSVAVAMGRTIQAHLAEVEAARQVLTAPLLEAQRKLMALKVNHCESLMAEKARLGALVSTFQTQEAERVRLEHEAREKEIARLEAESQTAALMAKLAQEASNAAPEHEQAIADIEAANAALMAQGAEQDTLAVICAPLPAPIKANGSSTKIELCFEVTDAAALWAARPDLCRPPEAKPSAIKAVCRVTDRIPGLRLWAEVRTSFRR